MMTIEHVEGTAVFDQLADQWNTLAKLGVTNTPFQTWTYQRSWFTHLGEGELHTLIAKNEKNGDDVVGIIPLNVRDGVVLFNASKEETDYLDVIASAEHVEEVWSAAFDFLLTSPPFEWQSLDLWNIPAWSPSFEIVQKLAAQHNLTVQTEQAEVCPCIPLTGTFADYLANIDKKQRHEIKRKMRRAAGAEAEITICNPVTEEELSTAVDAFLFLLRSSTFEKGEWLNDGRRALFHDVAQAAHKAGTLQLLFVEVEGQNVAGLFNFVHDGRTWVYNSGLLSDVAGNLSLGVVISAKAIELATELGNHTFDFLRGDEQYKYRFGAEDTIIHRVIITR